MTYTHIINKREVEESQARQIRSEDQPQRITPLIIVITVGLSFPAFPCRDLSKSREQK
jgi:hypothetical protein